MKYEGESANVRWTVMKWEKVKGNKNEDELETGFIYLNKSVTLIHCQGRKRRSYRRLNFRNQTAISENKFPSFQCLPQRSCCHHA
jgi:hypothetical protein